MSFYVCATFDAYDPVTGFFVMKMDCIEWNEDDLGPWGGPKYNTKEECYAQSVCSQQANNPTTPTSNNYCGISISSVDFINRTDDSLTVNINIPEQYNNTYIEYALYDIQYNQLGDFQKLNSASDTLSLSTTFTISGNFNSVCAVAFRLVKLCSDEEGSGSIGSLDESGSETGSGASESLTGILFDKSSWATIIPEPFKSYVDTAADTWDSLLRYNSDVYNLIKQNDPGWNGLSLDSYTQFNDPAEPYVAACGPTETVDITNNDPNNIKTNAIKFQLLVNEYYLNNPTILLSEEDWVGVMVHELGHALGIGTLWELLDSYWLDGNKYLFAKNAYNTITNHTGSRYRVPLEDSGGGGTVSSHWENNNRSSLYPNSDGFSYPSCNFDIMVGYITLGSPKQISNLSKQFLVDIGYESLSTTPPSVVIQPPGIMTSNMEQTTISNMCGCASHCHSHNHIGTVDLINNIFIAKN